MSRSVCARVCVPPCVFPLGDRVSQEASSWPCAITSGAVNPWGGPKGLYEYKRMQVVNALRGVPGTGRPGGESALSRRATAVRPVPQVCLPSLQTARLPNVLVKLGVAPLLACSLQCIQHLAHLSGL